jgi:hypothetical protein
MLNNKIKKKSNIQKNKIVAIISKKKTWAYSA